MDPGIPVPPALYGGHERLVYMFAEEYIRLGHHVTLLAGPHSHCSGDTTTFGKNDLHRSSFQKTIELAFVWRYLRSRADNFDLIHNFGRLLYLVPILNHNVNKIMTYGRPITKKWVDLINKLPNKNLIYTACSTDCIKIGNATGRWETVYNAIDFDKYQVNTSVEKDAPLIFLGRIEEVKGTHTAVQVALQTNNSLIIAGNLEDEHRSFFERHIEPYIDDVQIKYLGPINDEQKNHYLGKSKALLFPIEWDEPFGMVMVEAMACGTPVIGYTIGAVPEVVDTGITGYHVRNIEEMKEALAKIDIIDRKKCREKAKERFNLSKIALDYLLLLANERFEN
jgi:glycosyltransferase involved in cell wall biosynthesis